MVNKITENLKQPEELESLYWKDPVQFVQSLEEAIQLNPDSETLKVWKARISYSESSEQGNKLVPLIWVGVLSILSFGFMKIPSFIVTEEEWFYTRFVPFIVIGSLGVYFFRFLEDRKVRWVVISAYAVLLSLMLLLPDTQSDSIIMAQIYMPFTLLSVLGLTFAGQNWKDPAARISFIQYLGELLILTVLILLGGVVLTALTLGLFHLIGNNIEEWYTENVVVWGLVTAPIVASYLYDIILFRKTKLATLLSNVFSPLFLVTVVVYLAVILNEGKSPYSDREFLITFNGLLLVVWGITVFSVSGRSKSQKTFGIVDIVNIALLVATLLINVVAITAIAYRFYEFGITPNRIAVSGANLLIFVHLILILWFYIKEIRSEDLGSRLTPIISNYLPCYTAWSLIMVIGLPILF